MHTEPVVHPTHFRQVLGHFCTGVTVVTGMSDGEPVGFSCQAFAALSLDPPLVLFCPGRRSSTWARIAPTGRFCVNVLAEDQTSLSRTFARSGTDKFAEVPWTASPHGDPVLHDVVAWIDCALWAEYDGGDHTIVVARVLDLGAHPERRPLLFHRGSYGLLDVSGGDG